MFWYFLILGIIFVFICSVIAWGLAKYMTYVFADDSRPSIVTNKILNSFLISPHEQHWRDYLISLLVFNLFGFIALFAILWFQDLLPWNPRDFGAMNPYLIFHTAASFVTNTNLQAYVPETNLSYFSQSVGLVVQHFLSAATGACVGVALIRGFAREGSITIGNFWSDMVRCVVFILLPVCILTAALFIKQGMPQNLNDYIAAQNYLIPQGPVASQTAIKIFGGNGGGFFAANAAHPYENPSLMSNYLQLALILIFPMSFIFLLGNFLKKPQEAMVLYAAVTILFLINFAVVLHGELSSAAWLSSGLTENVVYEGKELMPGILGSAMWDVSTTATANGSANMAVASQNSLSIFIMLLQMNLGEVFYGGVGTGFCTLILLALLSVFVGTLMIGRSPEYLSKKIEVFEIKAVMIALLIMPVFLFSGLGLVLLDPDVKTYILNTGPMGFTEIFYAYSSAAANNGSALNGFMMNDSVVLATLGMMMLAGRFLPIVALIIISGHLAAKKKLQPSIATLTTASPTFLFMLCFMIVILGLLTYFPLLTLGPLTDYLGTIMPIAGGK
ncbi:MAG: potassium-transporting ATPase subunit A [Alphaproteobacteria bacterium]|nr:MAG: potassium-transporting ATPase subunit A [Alphaproteobacteria bacterium]